MLIQGQSVLVGTRVNLAGTVYEMLPSLFLGGEGQEPRSRRYGRTVALRLLVQPYDEEDDLFFLFPM
jgi:hypothetical protein